MYSSSSVHFAQSSNSGKRDIASCDASMETTSRTSEPSSLQSSQEGPGSTEEVLSSGGEDLGGLGTGEGAIQPGGIPALSKPTSNSARPQLVQLGSNLGQTSSSGHHPKRFSAVNITKKFLEKNSSPSTSTPILQGSVATKPGGHSARPQTQVASSYSRLVTTKLTSTSSASSTSGVGWSRPSSAAPSNPTGSHSPTNELPALSTSGNPNTTPGVPQLPQSSKVIQPQPQATALGPSLSSKNATGERSSKPVWGHSRQTTALKLPDARHDFPTAAEVAQGIPPKERESRQNAGSIALIKQARMEEADTFRGVHLDPNAHHWDEMEEDDDNFLDGVIEFGDGRQYKIEPTDPVESSLSPDSEVKSTVDGVIPSEDSPSLPVSKKERFLDDFDRSWPRSATSPSSKKDISLPIGQPPVSPTTRGSRPLHETSRVLFNERSNRLEPYSSAQRPTSGQHRAYQETTASPTDSRNFRDASGASLPHNNIHPSHKSGSSDIQSQKFSGTSSGVHVPSGQHNREREPSTRWDGLPPSPLTPRDKEFHPEMGRRSDMGPPPIPSHAMRGHPRDGAPPPPHMSPPLTGRLSSRHPRSQKVPILSTPDSIRFPPQSPASSIASLVSPATAATALPLMSAPELDGVQKDVMQSAAARAKQRRQQEEEEREKEKERARRKAAELEERMKVAQEALTKSVVEQDDAKEITPSEEVVQPVEVSSHTAPQLALPSTASVTSRPPRPPPLQSPASDHPRRSSTSAPALPLAMQTDSWRNKSGLLSPSSPSQVSQAPVMTAPLIESPALDPLASFAYGPDEDLEVVEYSDMGRFVGDPDALEPATVEEQHVNSGPPNATVRNEEVSASASSITPGPNSIATDFSSETDLPKNHFHVYPPVLTSELTTTASKETLTSTVAPSHFKTPRNHNEASISALDDAMSRIKGAINGIQAAETGKELSLPVVDIETSMLKATSTQGTGGSISTQSRWIPPALRLPNANPDPRETFDVTGMEPPRSPEPAWKFIVHLPTLSRYLEPVNKKQLSVFMKPPSPVRWDILSFDPPVERMNRRDLSLNEILFGKPPLVVKGKGRYRVSLPRSRTTFRMNPGHHALKLNNVGAFGRPAGADGVMTWRKSTPTATESFATLKEDAGAGTSSSPPPSASRSESSAASQPVEHPTPTNKANEQGLPPRYRPQPKMPLGSSVAFYRDSRIDAVEEEVGSSVNFIVTSELESTEESAIIPEQKSTPASPTESDSVPNANPPSASTTHGADATEHIPPLIHSKTESKGSDDLSGSLLITPPTHHLATWARNALSIPVKESPVRVPDPEHLKAVWSQTSNKAGLHAVNSLEGIADDLTAIPFTIQEVKSEDGETPPPSVPAPPSRMSLHDVTRAFQQVPTSSSSSSSTPHRTPSTVTPPATRPSNYTYANPIRPTYPYPSPMMGHSHPSNAMYPHPMPASPIPGRMPINGHAPMYTQPMWVPLAAPGQNHGNMMRSPYPAQLIPYPSSGTPGLYGSQPPQNMQASPQQQPGGQINRDRPMSMMSPALSHAGPALYGSPVLMHAPLMQVPQNHTYMVPTSRPVRTENGQLGMQQHSQQTINHETPNYNSVAPFVRPTW